MPTKFEICTNALVQIGAAAITDFAGGSTESEVCGYIYQPTVDNWLAQYPWRFATKEATLSRNVTAPTGTRWSASYAQPGDMIALQSVEIGSTTIPFDRFENKIYCDAGATDVVTGVYTYAISETYWPAYFVELIEMALMAKLSFALPAKLDLRKINDDATLFKYRMAKAADSRQQPSRVLPVKGRNTIMEARRA